MPPVEEANYTEAFIDGIEQPFVEILAFALRPLGQCTRRNIGTFNEDAGDGAIRSAQRLIDEVEIMLLRRR